MNRSSRGKSKTEMMEQLNWQLQVNAALAELYKPLISPEVSIEDITHVILAQGKHLTDSEHGYVAYIDPITKDEVAYTLTEMLKDQCDVDKNGEPIVFPIGKDGRYPSLWGHALNTREAFYTNAPDKHPASRGTPTGHVRLKRFLTVPVMLGDELVGQIGLANPIRDYTDRHLEAIRRLGEFYALAIQHRQTEDKIRISEEKYRKLFEEAIDGIALADAGTGIILDCNPALCEMVGRDKAELIGQHQHILHPPAREKGEFTHTFRQHLEEKEPHVLEDRLITKSGAIKVVAIKAKRYELAGKEVMQGMFRDITEHKQMEDELRKHREHLEELVKARTAELSAAHERLRQAQKMEAIGTLAGGIAHDFNNVLGAIIGYTELAMLDIPDNSIPKNNLEQVLTAAQRAKDMVKQILAFSRKEKKERKLVSFSDIIREAVKFLRSTLPTTIDISVDIRENLDPVLANPTQLHQVIMNICANASHAMRESGGLIKIELKEILHSHEGEGKEVSELVPSKYQKLSVSDTGPGMPPEILERIFEPYFTTKEVGEGTGMGLAVVHGIVKGHSGDIIVNSTPGKGTTVHVFLPVVQNEEIQEIETPPATAIPGKGEGILFVDDEEILADMGKLMLEKLGYRVTTHTSSVDALVEFRKTPDQFDLLLVDMTMPKLTGIQLAKECKSTKANIPVILCTGFSNRINEENFKSQGIDAFIMKPIKMTQLAILVREILDKNVK